MEAATTGMQNLVPAPIDINEPNAIWDQNTFSGRLNRFFRITNPLLLFKSKQEYKDAKDLVTLAR